MAIQYVRHEGNCLTIQAPDAATADLLSALCDLWVTGPQLQSTDLGVLDVYNAARLRLQLRLEKIGEQIDALDTMNNPAMDLHAQLDPLVAERVAILRVLQATEIDTNPEPV